MNFRNFPFIALAALSLAGCATSGEIFSDVTSSTASESPSAAVQQAQSLLQQGRNEEAVAVLQKAVVNGGGRDAQAAYGKALITVGRFDEARNVLSSAHTPDKPDPLILSALGTVEDQTGNHDAARAHYERALRITPNDPRILSNMGMSYVLTKDLNSAEAYLQRAADNPQADDRVMRNLDLVLGLRKKSAARSS